MKKMIRTAVVALSIACATCAVALPGMAASTGETPKPYVANTSGSYRTSVSQTQNKLKASAFLAPVVYVNPVTHAISNVYDADGNLIPATLSTDGHYYIVPTNEGYLYIATGY